MIYKFKSWDDCRTIELLPCPFCGGEPDLQHIGNDYVKTKKIRIKCKKCFIQRTQAALRDRSFEWLENKMAEHWNKRSGGADLRMQLNKGEDYASV